jgi:hypothetical protein
MTDSLCALSNLSDTALAMGEVRSSSATSRRKKHPDEPKKIQQTIMLDEETKAELGVEAERRGMTQGKLGGLAVKKFLKAQRIKRKLFKQ